MNSFSLRLGRLRPGVSVLLVGTLAALLAGCGSSGTSAVKVDAITVDGTSITQSNFERDVSALAANAKLKALDASVAQQGTQSERLFDPAGHATRVLTTSWLNRLTNQIVVDQEFKNEHLKTTAADVTEGQKQFAQLFATSSADGTAVVKAFPTWFQTQENAREARLVAVTRVLDAKHPITKAQEQAFYAQNVGSLCASGINVSHILVKTLPEAQAIEAELAQGAKFSDLATQKSIDTTSAKNGGSLGCFATGEFVPEFEAAAQKAKIGVPTAPVHSQFGYHVILTSKYVPPTFAQLEPQIRQQILQTLNLVQKFVAAGLKKATVRVNPVYGTWDKKTYRVVAPKVPAVRNSRHETTTTPTPTS